MLVLRQEYEKARGGQMQGQGGVYQQGYGSYAGSGGQDQGQYAGYYGVSASQPLKVMCVDVSQQQQDGTTPGSQPPQTPAQGGAAPAALPQPGTEAYQQYAAYWAAYGYDVNDPQCKSSQSDIYYQLIPRLVQAWQASQYGQQQPGGQTPAA